VTAQITSPQRRETGDTRRDWRHRLPELNDGTVRLRQLRMRDAPSLLRHMNDPAVLQFIAPCPTTVEGFEAFVRWTHTERRRGRHACYGIVPQGADAAVGIIQLWSVEREFSTAEWGFVIGQPFWGTGVFTRSAQLFLDAVFLDSLFGSSEVLRLESRAVIHNHRGNGFFRKLGATREGVLRGGFRLDDGVCDQVMWSILAPEWIDIRRSSSNDTPCLAR
jgi:RimJ/RimL family protein N-acetyltransferase